MRPVSKNTPRPYRAGRTYRADKTIISQIILRLSAPKLLDNITKQREYVTAQREENGQERSENYEYWYGFPCKSAEKDCEEYSTAETADESKCICCGCLGFTGSRSWKKKPVEAVADVRQSTDAATASFLPLADTHQGRSTQQKPKNASDKKQTSQKSKDIVDAGITALIQKALDAKKVMAEPDIAERLQSSMESEFMKLFTPEEPQDNKFVSTATFRATKKKAGTLNVAAYIRVSTDMSDQENSYETQEKYFNQLIENNPAWNAVGVYSDYGISGTSKEKRTGFRRLMRHCKDGKIDRIVCKSISRFARNTADFMSALDVLHDCGVTILFEKENLDTADPTSDFILTTLAAIAQEESRSISSNIRLGQKMRFPKGDVPNKIMYGYRYNGKMVTSESGYEYKDIEIVEEEARVVRRIFHEVVEGKAYTEIARGLNMDKIPAPVTDAVRVRKKNPRKGS